MMTALRGVTPLVLGRTLFAVKGGLTATTLKFGTCGGKAIESDGEAAHDAGIGFIFDSDLRRHARHRAGSGVGAGGLRVARVACSGCFRGPGNLERAGAGFRGPYP